MQKKKKSFSTSSSHTSKAIVQLFSNILANASHEKSIITVGPINAISMSTEIRKLDGKHYFRFQRFTNMFVK